ncbi:MAG: phosphate acetyltransferase, partial [Rhizobiaceae bacterium]|nr:phosphate acetyltransferase [Rhizobiaceae bacterium]
MTAAIMQQDGASKYERLIRAAGTAQTPVTVVVHPCDEPSLRGAMDAAAAGLIRPILVGPPARIVSTATQNGIDISGCDIVETPHSHASAAR